MMDKLTILLSEIFKALGNKKSFEVLSNIELNLVKIFLIGLLTIGFID
jgi:hypothetical protein